MFFSEIVLYSEINPLVSELLYKVGNMYYIVFQKRMRLLLTSPQSDGRYKSTIIRGPCSEHSTEIPGSCCWYFLAVFYFDK